MIKAKKGLLIALFAAMMVFAFGATSAFAATAKWAPDYSTVTINDTTYNTIRTIDASNGVIKAVPDFSDYDASVIPQGDFVVYYYDFNGAALNILGNYNKTQFEDLFWWNGVAKETPSKVILKTPDYVKKTTAEPPEAGVKPEATYKVTLTGWVNTVKLPEEYDASSTAAQTVTVVGKITSDGEATGTSTQPYQLNKADLTKIVNVAAGGAATAFYKDSTKDGDRITAGAEQSPANPFTVAWKYDGFEHTIAYTTAKDHTIAWSVLNNETGLYDPVTAPPVVKNVADEYSVKATETWTKEINESTTQIVKVEYKFNMSVTGRAYPSDRRDRVYPNFGWTKGNGGQHNGVTYTYEVTAAQAADPAAFIEIANGFVATESERNYGNVEADMDTIKAFFNDCYDVVVTKNTIDAELQNWTIEPKTLTADEKTALQKKYKDLYATYRLDEPGENDAMRVVDNNSLSNDYVVTVSVKGEVNPDTKVDDINFVQAPNTTYHVKKAKKLKKTKSFTVNAVADSGNVITYRIDSPSKKITIDSATGKVTVKKGLKKGTYKVTVKAKTEAGNGYQACMASRQLTIKIKK